MLDGPSAAFLGMLQGILEWLPVSSSGQTTIVMVDFLEVDIKLAITLGLAIHIGTALAVIAKYPRHLLALTRKSETTKFYWTTTATSLAVALPLVILLEETFNSEVWTGVTITLFIGFALIVTGIVLVWAKKRTFRRISSGGFADRILLGVAQGIAVLPGISRSGMTVGTLLIRGFEKRQALVFSFLLAVPVSIAASVYFLVFGEVASIGIWLFVIAAFFAFIFGYLTMEGLVRFARDMDFSIFCIFFGGLAIVVPLLLWSLG
jgi:undecaprenyl-diphosphatase